MSELEQLKLDLQNLINERERILRGLGQRYSRRFKPTPYDKKIHKSYNEYEDFTKAKLSKTQKNIKNAKLRISQISDEISDLKQKMRQQELINFKSSKNFNGAFNESIKILSNF